MVLVVLCLFICTKGYCLYITNDTDHKITVKVPGSTKYSYDLDSGQGKGGWKLGKIEIIDPDLNDRYVTFGKDGGRFFLSFGSDTHKYRFEKKKKKIEAATFDYKDAFMFYKSGNFLTPHLEVVRIDHKSSRMEDNDKIRGMEKTHSINSPTNMYAIIYNNSNENIYFDHDPSAVAYRINKYGDKGDQKAKRWSFGGVKFYYAGHPAFVGDFRVGSDGDPYFYYGLYGKASGLYRGFMISGVNNHMFVYFRYNIKPYEYHFVAIDLHKIDPDSL